MVLPTRGTRKKFFFASSTPLRDGGGDLAGLAVADADQTVAVTDDDESGEAEATTTLDDLRDAVDRDDALEELALVVAVAAAAAALVAVAATLAATAVGATDPRGCSTPSRQRSRRGARRRPRPAPSPRRSRAGGVVFVASLTGSAQPSRAPSAIAATRPAYLLPPRSKTTASMPAALARSATSSPTLRALAVLSPSNVRRSASRVDALARVWPLLSSTTCTKT